MKFLANKPVKTHIISGFLGAGKTTLLQALLKQKPENEIWAVLMNEFGQIGVDQVLLPNSAGYEVRELLGGCLCCASQLPMQIALSRLIQETQPDRLFIEPTGLGHPAQLIEQLTEPHWHNQIDMRALVTVVNGAKLHEQIWDQEQLYQDQLKAAQIVVLSHANEMSDTDQHALVRLQNDHLAYVQHWYPLNFGDIDLASLDIAYEGIQKKIQPLLKVQRSLMTDETMPEVRQLPYHYVEHAQGYTVAGWKLPKSWIFDFYDLLDVLCELKNWQRIKGIFNTNQGWKSFNFNPDQFNYKSNEPALDNRVEVITKTELDWYDLEQRILKCRIDNQHQD